MGAIEAQRLAAGWLIAAVPSGLYVLGPRVELEVALEGGAAEAAALAGTLAHWNPDAPPGPQGTPPPGPVAALIQQLEDLGAYERAHDSQLPAPGSSLAAALRAAREGRPPEGTIWTADEALVCPVALPEAERVRALRAFVSGLAPDGRLMAYALLAQGAGAVHGDVPVASRHKRASAAGSSHRTTVVELADGGRTWTVGPAGVDALDTRAAHRLGPLLALSPGVPVDDREPELVMCVGEVAVANLNLVASRPDRLVQGVGSGGDQARLIARAEAAERHAGAELAHADLRSAAQSELPRAVDPRTLFARAGAGSAHGDAHPACGSAATDPRLWALSIDGAGEPWHVPAETVYTSASAAADAARLIPWSGSGVAAHLTLEAARTHALHELIERDAFMWTWLQGVSRERIAAAGVPERARAHQALLAADGWQTTWVNVSLDTLPVILCALTHAQFGLTLGASCGREAPVALERATVEAMVLALRLKNDGPPPQPEAVRTPRDHLLLHRDPARLADHGFLFAAREEIELGDVPGAGQASAEEHLRAQGFDPVSVDLTLPASAPFRVVRALVPGLLPLTFGYGNEPAGLLRARSRLRTTDNRTVGHDFSTGQTSARVPHPFP
jgi:thiazole/oxazole-forming peptide maturase SagD family component